MTDTAFLEILLFARCPKYLTDTCPQRKNTSMKLTEINAPRCFLLNDQTVDELNQLCERCSEFQLKSKGDQT